MFSIKIHTVDTAEALYTTTTTNSSSSTPSGNPITQLRGLIHLFRQSSSLALSNPAARSTLLFIVAVPNYVSPDDFLLFCGSQLHDFNQLIFLRNDGVEDRYSVLIKLNNQLSSDGFFCNFNGKRFQPSQAEVCHIYFIQSVEYTELGEIASAPPPAFVELPTCPVCLERLDHDTSAIQTTLCDHSFHCSCVSRWTYLSCQVCRLCQQQDEKPSCAVCGRLNNPWVCLICGFVGCGRYKEGHAIKHWNDTQHCYSLELETQQIWDYVGDKYVHRLNQSKIDSKSVMTNFHCTSDDGGCGTFGSNEDYSGIGDAIYSSKVEQIVDEYNHLLATQMETQRQHYETLLTEAKSRRENSLAKAVEVAEVTMTQNLQDRIEELTKEKKAAADMNEELVKKQEKLRRRLKDIEHREISSSNSKDEKILDLQEQIRDLKVYIEAQRTLSSMTDADDIKGGTLLPIQSNQSSASTPKRRTKSGRKRN